jgi:hypothetical protein
MRLSTSTPSALRPLTQRRPIVLLPYVQANKYGRTAQVAGDWSPLAFQKITQNYIGAFIDKRRRNAAADSTTSARYNRMFVFKASCFVPTHVQGSSRRMVAVFHDRRFKTRLDQRSVSIQRMTANAVNDRLQQPD